MDSLYQVVFTGRLKPGVDAAQASQDFAAVFKVPDEKARALIGGGAERVLKKDVTADSAERYREVLDEIGLLVRVESAAGSPGPKDTGAAGAAPGVPSGERGTAVPSGPDMDPYVPPTAAPTMPSARGPADVPMTGPHPRPAGHGWQWIVGGFELFKGAPAAWIGAVVVLMLLNVLMSLVPMLGGILSTLVGPVFLGGLMLGAHAQAGGGRLRVEDLFAGFSAEPRELFAVGGLYLLGVFAIVLVVVLLVGVLGAGLLGLDPAELEQQDPVLMAATVGPIALLALLFVMLLFVPLLMAYWFAPVLVVLQKMKALEAMKLSFAACWRNIVPFLVYGLTATLLLIVALIPFGLGLLIVSPMLVASIYAAYRDVFYE
jgi:uncharacterized membrane protein